MQLPADSTPPWAIGSSAYAPLAEDRRADVVVIGAGIAGLTTAALLARAGKEVVVLEGRSVGSGTSGRTTAKVSALQGARYQVLADVHDEDTAARYARAQLDALAWMAEQAGPVEAAQWERRTALTYATTEAGRSKVEQEARAATAAGLDVELGGADLPFEATASVMLADQAQLDPGPYLAALAAEIAASPNGTVHEDTRVTAVRGHRTFRVVTPRATVSAQHVVVATLLPITDRGFFFARAEPKSSYLVALDVAGSVPQTMSLSVDEPSRSMRTARIDGQERLLVGGEGHHTGRGGPTLARYQALVDWAQEHFPVNEVVARWSAHDYVPADHLPWVGAASFTSPHLLVATGFEKWGMTMGTAAALLLADTITGTEGVSTPWGAIFDPKRMALRGLPTAARLNAEVAGHMASDWIKPEAGPASDGTGRRRRSGLVPVGEPEPSGPAVRVVCTHLGGVCGWNDGDRTWDCPLHGSRFEGDGTVLAAPAIRPLRSAEPPSPTPDA
ncbi:MAG: Glycine/D-amino acid oxidase [Ilumatobacteraceae bacterium]|nr:Glycine/D-amino acid oxidase [Ilumatobacteraceae bacterium]